VRTTNHIKTTQMGVATATDMAGGMLATVGLTTTAAAGLTYDIARHATIQRHGYDPVALRSLRSRKVLEFGCTALAAGLAIESAVAITSTAAHFTTPSKLWSTQNGRGNAMMAAGGLAALGFGAATAIRYRKDVPFAQLAHASLVNRWTIGSMVAGVAAAEASDLVSSHFNLNAAVDQ
jgi:hypothetical protein